MSQVIRKLQSGGSPSKPKLFNYDGVGQYELEPMVQALAENIERYADEMGFKGERRSNFINSAALAIDELRKGNMSRNLDRSFITKSDAIQGNGKYDTTLFGKIKATDNNAFNDVYHYFSKYLDTAKKYKEPEEKPKAQFDAYKYITDELSKQYYAGTGIDSDNWYNNRSDEDRVSAIQNIINQIDYNKLYDSYDWSKSNITSAEDLKNLWVQFHTALSNKTLDNNDYNTFAAIGGKNLNKLLVKPEQESEEQQDSASNIQEEQKKKQINSLIEQGYTKEQAQQIVSSIEKDNAYKRDTQYQAIIDRGNALDYLTELNDYITKNPFVEDTRYSGILPQTDTDLSEKYKQLDKQGISTNDYFEKNLSSGIFLQRPELWSNTFGSMSAKRAVEKKIADNIKMASELGYLFDIGDGWKAIPSTFDMENYTAIAYNPSSRAYKQVSMIANDKLKQELFKMKNLQYPTIQSNKKGGILKAQYGLSFAEKVAQMEAQQKELNKQLKDKQQQEFKQKAKGTSRTPADIAKDSQPGFVSSGNMLRASSLIGDISSLIMNYAGASAPASAIAGGISTGLNQAADMADGYGFWESLGNNAVSYGMDIISLIPFAKTAKIPKMVKNAAKLAPWVIGTLATYQGMANAPEYIKSWEKILSGEEKQIQDWRNILESLQLVIGGTAAGSRAIKTNKRLDASISGDEQWIKTNNGMLKVKTTDLDKIKQAKTLSEQNKILQEITRTNATLPEQVKGNIFKKKKQGVADIQTDDYYDFSKPVIRYSYDLPIEYKWSPLETWMGTRQMTSNTKFADNYNKIFHPQAYQKQQNKISEPRESIKYKYDPTLKTVHPKPYDYTLQRTINKNLGVNQEMVYDDTSLYHKMLEQKQNSLWEKLLSKNKIYSRSKMKPKVDKKAQGGLILKFQNSGSIKGNGIMQPAEIKSKTSTYNIKPEDFLDLGRMVGGLVTNIRAANKYKEGLKPLLIDTSENIVPLEYDWLAKKQAEDLNAQLRAITKNNETSDPSLQLLKDLEIYNKQRANTQQANAQAANRFYQTRAAGQQASDQAKTARTEAANRNRASMLQIDATKHMIDSGLISSNYEKVLAPYLAGISNNYRQSAAIKKQAELQNIQNSLMLQMQPLYNKAIKEGNIEEAQRLIQNYKQKVLELQTNALNQPNMFFTRQPKPNSSTFQFKSGGRLTAKERAIIQQVKDFNKRTLEDNKTFHKNVMESKKEHNKLIMSMSALTAELIKNGMSWK